MRSNRATWFLRGDSDKSFHLLERSERSLFSAARYPDIVFRYCPRLFSSIHDWVLLLYSATLRVYRFTDGQVRSKCEGTRRSDYGRPVGSSYVSNQTRDDWSSDLKLWKWKWSRLGTCSARSFGNLKTRSTPITRRSLRVSSPKTPITRHQAFWLLSSFREFTLEKLVISTSGRVKSVRVNGLSESVSTRLDLAARKSGEALLRNDRSGSRRGCPPRTFSTRGNASTASSESSGARM